MGGNALKNIETRRYVRDEYERIAKAVLEKLNPVRCIDRAIDIPAYRTKETFGDLDILYSTNTDTPLSVEQIEAVFSPDEIVRNTNVISFNYEELQVDLIHSPRNCFDYALSYFSWNDTGNLIGRIAHKFGVKHGHAGLIFPVRESDQVIAEIVLTTDHDLALTWLGFDAGVFNAGFDSLDQIFNFVTSNPFYNPEFYKLENLNNIARTRDTKRSTYSSFLEHGRTMTGTFWTPVSDKTWYAESMFRRFPEATKQFKEAMQQLAFMRQARTKFNGDIVSDLTGLTGKPLGEFMRHLKTSFWLTPEMVVFQSTARIVSIINMEFDTFKLLTKDK